MKIGPFPRGMNNKAEDHDLPKGCARNLVNVDIPPSGRPRSRGGYDKVYSGMNCRGGFDCPSGIFFVEGAQLKRFNANDTATVLFSGVYGDTLTFEYENGIVYFSDGSIAKKILADHSVVTWGMDPPPAFTLVGVAGSFGSGVYTAAMTYVDANGVESGASEISSFTAPDDSTGIKFIFSNASDDPQAVGMNLYLSMPNGSTLFLIGTVALGTETYSVLSGQYDDARYLELEMMDRPPAGRIIRHFSGRKFIALASGLVIWTEEFDYDHVRYADNYLQLPEAADVMEPVDDGIYFAYGNTTKFFAGRDPKAFIVHDVFDYGGVLGTGHKIENSDQVAWFSTRGAIIAGPGGGARNIQEKSVAPDIGQSGAMVLREENGIRQLLASLKDSTTSTLACMSFMEAEVIRRGE